MFNERKIICILKFGENVSNIVFEINMMILKHGVVYRHAQSYSLLLTEQAWTCD